MPVRPPNNESRRASAPLSAAIETLFDGPERGQPLTLEGVRIALQNGGIQWSPEGELLHLQDRTSLLIELDDLIERYGANASARSFLSRGPV